MNNDLIEEKQKTIQTASLEAPAQKEERWQKNRDRINRIVDENGDPVDKGIREVVTAFNVNGFPTTGSCQGHIESGLGSSGPWIDVQTPESEEGLALLESNALNDVDRKEIEAELEPNYRKYLASMVQALSNFYETRHVPFEQQLSIQGSRPFSFRVQNNGSGLPQAKSAEEQQKKLRIYQTELLAFGEFLKERYFNS